MIYMIYIFVISFFSEIQSWLVNLDKVSLNPWHLHPFQYLT